MVNKSLLLAFAALLAVGLAPAAALAEAGTPVSETPSGLLFALGLLGVLIGRQASARRGRRED